MRGDCEPEPERDGEFDDEREIRALLVAFKLTDVRAEGVDVVENEIVVDGDPESVGVL